jgi:nucleoside-diphosphate-sugar epimerase
MPCPDAMSQNALEGSLLVQEKKLLITGASGFVGQHLTPALAERGHRVVAVVRHPGVFGPTVNQVLIQDITSVDWMPLLQGIDVVIHLAAIAHRGNDVAEAVYDKINRQVTASLARATARAGARLIFLSSVAAQSPSSSDLPLTEKNLCTPAGGYGRSKLNAEIDIAASGGQYIILRPPLIYGRGVKGNMHKLIQLARLPVPLPFGAVTNKRSLLAIENLISAIGLLIQRDDIRNEVFLVADATPVSLPEIIASLRHGTGRPANLFAIPPPLLLGLFRMCRLTETWEKLAGNLVASIDKLSSIGYSPVVTTSQGLAVMTRALLPRSAAGFSAAGDLK